LQHGIEASAICWSKGELFKRTGYRKQQDKKRFLSPNLETEAAFVGSNKGQGAPLPGGLVRPPEPAPRNVQTEIAPLPLPFAAGALNIMFPEGKFVAAPVVPNP
jgi:hypothetical protein